ncbi:MFS transporter [Campylobacter jejuni]|nr:MFS transporter [Campylobacter jejuni]
MHGFRSYFVCSCKCFTWFFKFFYAYVGFVIALGVFQGMGVGPSFITLANWYPKKERGIYTAVWNISHNIGGGIVAPIVSLSGFALAALLGVSMANFNETYWHMNHVYVPAACAVIISLYVLYAVKGSPKNEGLVDITEINEMRGIKTEEIKAIETPNLNSFEIFYHYVLKNKNA